MNGLIQSHETVPLKNSNIYTLLILTSGSHRSISFMMAPKAIPNTIRKTDSGTLKSILFKYSWRIFDPNRLGISPHTFKGYIYCCTGALWRHISTVKHDYGTISLEICCRLLLQKAELSTY
jgi:hypothetical protein